MPCAPARVEQELGETGYVAECLRVPNGRALDRHLEARRAPKFLQAPVRSHTAFNLARPAYQSFDDAPDGELSPFPARVIHRV